MLVIKASKQYIHVYYSNIFKDFHNSTLLNSFKDHKQLCVLKFYYNSCLIPHPPLPVLEKQMIMISFLIPEPNNDSPLNAHAAELWSDQAQYKKVLLERYKRDVADKRV